MRGKNAETYVKIFNQDNHIILPTVIEYCSPAWHLFVIRAPDRDNLIGFLSKNKIQTGIHYPIPLHLTQAYSNLGYKAGDFPIAEKVQKEIISLPMYAELSADDIAHVADKIKEFYLH